MQSRRILIADDEKNIRTVLKLLFESEGYRVDCVENGEEAWTLLEAGEPYGLVISDLKMGGLDGIALLMRMRERGNGIPFVLMTAYGTIESAVDAMKSGAVDVVTKPFTKKLMLNVAERIFKVSCLENENLRLKQGLEAQDLKEDELVKSSPKMAEIADLVERIGPVSAPVLLTGESGTGKEVLARSIHRAYSGGDFDSRPFVSVNCPAVPEQLLESELFGYRRGAFTGAEKDFKGRVELADGGTLFFDEIGDLPPSIQPKLLRVLETRTIEPLGSGHSRKVDIRIICATNRDLDALVREGRFRVDLMYRINTFTVFIPPLRERREDIPILARHFLARFSRELRKDVRDFEGTVLGMFAAYEWPGNVRELRNIVERAVVLCKGTRLTEADIPREIRLSAENSGKTSAHASTVPLPVPFPPQTAARKSSALEEAELVLIRDALARTCGNVSEAARELGITRNTLRYRMRKFGLEEGI